MSNLGAIIYATRASASALASEGRHARAAADACTRIANLSRSIASGRLPPSAAAVARLELARAEGDLGRAERAARAARTRFNSAQTVLASNPL